MKILVIGNGGREHALAWQLARGNEELELVCAPGNAGIAEIAECVNIPATDIQQLTQFASERKFDLTIVGPEAPLCNGIVDAFEAKGLKIFGPTREAAQLEGSKAFAKEFLLTHKIPTAAARVFKSAAPAREFVRKMGAPIVVKADGLAAGKGVIVAQTIEEADKAISDMMEEKLFGEAGARVMIEECLKGEEVSVMALLDGKTVKLLTPAQDHKRAYDGDKGPNTGGMGAYSPTPMLTPEVRTKVFEMFLTTLSAFESEYIKYRGVLYAGLMLTETGPKVLEFNCRFGDPETQVVLPRLETNLAEVLLATAESRLETIELEWKREAAVCVVMTSKGYPGAYDRGVPITGLKAAAELSNVSVFHAGTKKNEDGEVVTDGGRVLGVTALGKELEDATLNAYEAVSRIRFEGAQYRRDIAAHALLRNLEKAK